MREEYNGFLPYELVVGAPEKGLPARVENIARERLKKAAEKELKVILNPAPAAKIPEEVYPYIFAITPNETETELLLSKMES